MTVIFLASGCAGLYARVEQPLRIQNPDDLAAEDLELEIGSTTLSEAVGRMRALGLTGVRRTQFQKGDSTELSAIAADYQTRVHIFEDERYSHSVQLATTTTLPYEYGLRFVVDGERTILLVLYDDPLRWTARRSQAQGPWLTTVARESGRFQQRSRMRIGGLAGARSGAAQPLFVGYDLEEGLLLYARDREGRPWRDAYMLRSDAGRIAVAPVPFLDAVRCSCIQDYLDGEGPTTTGATALD